MVQYTVHWRDSGQREDPNIPFTLSTCPAVPLKSGRLKPYRRKMRSSMLQPIKTKRNIEAIHWQRTSREKRSTIIHQLYVDYVTSNLL